MTNDGVAVEAGAARPAKTRVFTFGEPETVLDGGRLSHYIEVWHNGRYYEPPVNPRNLSRLINASPHHRSAIALKKNLLLKYYIEHPLLSVAEFEKFVLDYLVQGNAYLEMVPNRMGRPAQLVHSLAQNTRVGLKPGQYYWLDDTWQDHEFAPGRVYHMREYDTSQEIYGLPEYLSAMQAILLNEAATLFRRRYYINGAHAGFILYITDPEISDEDAQEIEEQVVNAKGVGNFKNMFIHSPSGKEKGLQILPISEVAAKDEFLGIKNTSRDDVLAGWRTPPQLMGVVPANSGGFGDVEKASDVFFENEIAPLQRKVMGLNAWLGQEVVRFAPRVTAGAKA